MKKLPLYKRARAFENEINEKIFAANRPVKEAMGKRDPNIKEMSEEAFAHYLAASHAGRHPISPGIIRTNKQLESSIKFYERNPIYEGTGWSRETTRDIFNYMEVNDINEHTNPELLKRLSGLSDAQAREFLAEVGAYKDVVWASETDQKSHKTGRHMEELAQTISTQILNEMGQ